MPSSQRRSAPTVYYKSTGCVNHPATLTFVADVEFKGMDTLIGTIKQMSPRVTEFLTDAMQEVSQDVFNESQVQVPVRYGVLKGSGHVDPPEMGPTGVQINIGYGGAAAEYAYFVHENMAAQHRFPTKAKYLEDPMNDALKSLVSRLQDRMEGVIMGQYPQAPAKAVTAEGRSDMARGFSGASKHAVAAHIAHSRAMTPSEVTAALRRLSGGR